MALITIDPLAIKTFERLSAIRALIDLLDASLPEVELRERDKLKRLAKEQDWDFGDYTVETQILDERFGHWMPRLSAYSVITLLQSVVEADRKSTRLNSSHMSISYAVFCLKKKK